MFTISFSLLLFFPPIPNEKRIDFVFASIQSTGCVDDPRHDYVTMTIDCAQHEGCSEKIIFPTKTIFRETKRLQSKKK